LLLVHSVDEDLLVGAAVSVGGEPGEPEQDDCYDDEGEDDEVAWLGVAQCGIPVVGSFSSIEGVEFLAFSRLILRAFLMTTTEKIAVITQEKTKE
jgi:hypothetical protein